MRRRELPVGLAPSFTVAQAVEAGVSRDRLVAADLDAPLYGLRSQHDLDDRARLKLLLEALPPHTFVCGPTAALLYELPLPAAFARSAVERPVIAVALPANRVRGRNIVGRALAVHPRDLVTRHGIRCTTVERTWIDVSGVLSVPSLVAATDRILQHRRPLSTLPRLEIAHSRAGRNRGTRRRIHALELASARSESPRESELRVLLVTAGLPTPECNPSIYDGDRFVARVDMLYREKRLIIEYDGDYHRDPVQWSRDQSRRAELESLGYRVTNVTARDFDDPDALIRRIRRLLAAT